ncbi:MAG: hypothetical protein ACRDTR_04750 [Rubrobacter sp.]
METLITVDTAPARSPADSIDRRAPAGREAKYQKAASTYRSPGNLGPPIAAPLAYALTMAMITTEAIGESAPIKTPGSCHLEARNASKAPDKPVAMSST